MLEDSCCITNSRNHLTERLGKSTWEKKPICLSRLCCSSLITDVDYRKASLNLYGLRPRDFRSVHTEGITRSGMACGLPKVCGMSTISGWELHLFCAGCENLLQTGLFEVLFVSLKLVNSGEKLVLEANMMIRERKTLFSVRSEILAQFRLNWPSISTSYWFARNQGGLQSGNGSHGEVKSPVEYVSRWGEKTPFQLPYNHTHKLSGM